MAITHSTGDEMRWAAYAFWKAAEANRAVRNGGWSRAAAGGGGPGGAGNLVAQSPWQWQWDEGQWRQLNLLS
jgi:hypothetical protein